MSVFICLHFYDNVMDFAGGIDLKLNKMSSVYLLILL